MRRGDSTEEGSFGHGILQGLYPFGYHDLLVISWHKSVDEICAMLGNDRFGRSYLLPAHCQRLLRYRPQRINIVKIDALYLVHGRIDIARDGDIDDEKRTIDAIGQRGSQICWGQ